MKLNEIREILTKFMEKKCLSKDDIEFIKKNILCDHEIWKNRISDIIQISVSKNKLNKSVQLKLKTNKIWFPISWRACASNFTYNENNIEEKRLTSAMRNAIRRQITTWRKSQSCNIRECKSCKTKDNLQVDHDIPTFKALKLNFLKNKSVPIEFELHRSTHGAKFLKKDAIFKKNWQDYHKSHATYQFLCQHCNCSKRE